MKISETIEFAQDFNALLNGIEEDLANRKQELKDTQLQNAIIKNRNLFHVLLENVQELSANFRTFKGSMLYEQSRIQRQISAVERSIKGGRFETRKSANKNLSKQNIRSTNILLFLSSDSIIFSMHFHAGKELFLNVDPKLYPIGSLLTFSLILSLVLKTKSSISISNCMLIRINIFFS